MNLAPTSIIKTKIAKQPVVVLSLKEWEKIEDELEDLEMVRSSSYAKRVAKARGEKKSYSSQAVKKMLKL